VTPLRRNRRGDDLYGGGDLAPIYPQTSPNPYATPKRGSTTTAEPPPPDEYEPPPGFFRRIGQRLDDFRRAVLPLPDEVIDQYLGHGERMIHSDHPSFQAFFVQNTILFLVLFVVATVFFGISFNGSLITAGFVLLALSIVLLYLVLKRLRERYTSYVVTNVRIMRISGVFARRAHSIPWVRVTDLTYEQSLSGRLFGFATLHIESANEDSGLRNLEGVNDPVKFNQYVVDMVVAKQGPTAPGWEEQGEPAPIISAPHAGLFDRWMQARRQRRAQRKFDRAERARQAGQAEQAQRAEQAEKAWIPGRERRRPTAPVLTDISEEMGSEVVVGDPTLYEPDTDETDEIRDPTASGDYDFDEYGDLDEGGTDDGLPWRR
jgi:membrane protein YdbS with pleckstrin-like domain